MRSLLVLLLACGSPNPRDVPLDHELHDLSSETDEAKHLRYGGKQVSLAKLPVADKVGLPVSGTADVMVDIAIPKTAGTLDYAKATGSISITCTQCQLGDDHTKLRLGDELMAALDIDGIAFGHLTAHRLEATFIIANGRLVLRTFKLASPDIELTFSLALDLAIDLDASVVRGCLRFRPTEALRARDPKLFDLLRLTGAARSDDGFEQVQLAGTFGTVKRLGRPCGR